MDRFIDKLARKAREERTPEIDVVDPVMAALGPPRPVVLPGFDPWAVSAVASVAVAAAVTLVSLPSWEWMTDPLTSAVLDIMGAIG